MAKQINTDTISHNEYYCSRPDSDFIDSNNCPRRSDDDDKVLAKKILRDDGTIKFMLRIDRNKQLYDPVNQINRTSRKPSSYRDDSIKYITVGHKAFFLYTKYLENLQPSWLNLAKREIG